MPAVQRDGDANGAGGVVSGGIASVRVNGSPVTVDGNPVSSHAPFGRPHSESSSNKCKYLESNNHSSPHIYSSKIHRPARF